MKKLIKRSYAKINLTLDVLNKRDDGYHNLEMIMQTINLYDELEFIKNDSDEITIKSNCDRLQKEDIKSNIIYKAIQKTFDYCQYNKSRGVDVILNKNIPLEAGLAGGSSNGAVAIKAINEMYDFNLTLQEMIDIGKSVGADIPFCLVGGTAKVTGIGEKIEPLKPHKKTDILLVKPNVSVSTKYIFDNLKINEIKNRPNIEKVIHCIENDNIKEVAKNLFNALEVVTFEEYDIIREIKEFMIENKSLGALMTGSGSCVFGYFENAEDLKICEEKLKKKFRDILVYKTTINNYGSRENYE